MAGSPSTARSRRWLPTRRRRGRDRGSGSTTPCLRSKGRRPGAPSCSRSRSRPSRRSPRCSRGSSRRASRRPRTTPTHRSTRWTGTSPTIPAVGSGQRGAIPAGPSHRVADSDLVSGLLKQVSRSFYLSLAVLPASVRPTIALAYLLARAADTIADTRLIERRARVVHLEALREELSAAAPGRVAAIIEAAASAQSQPAERRLLERLPAVLAAYRDLDPADRDRVRRVLATVVEG